MRATKKRGPYNDTSEITFASEGISVKRLKERSRYPTEVRRDISVGSEERRFWERYLSRKNKFARAENATSQVLIHGNDIAQKADFRRKGGQPIVGNRQRSQCNRE